MCHDPRYYFVQCVSCQVSCHNPDIKLQWDHHCMLQYTHTYIDVATYRSNMSSRSMQPYKLFMQPECKQHNQHLVQSISWASRLYLMESIRLSCRTLAHNKGLVIVSQRLVKSRSETKRFEHCSACSCLVWQLLLTGLSAVSCPLVYSLLIC